MGLNPRFPGLGVFGSFYRLRVSSFRVYGFWELKYFGLKYRVGSGFKGASGFGGKGLSANEFGLKIRV
jgi:hypothetical protein